MKNLECLNLSEIPLANNPKKICNFILQNENLSNLLELYLENLNLNGEDFIKLCKSKCLSKLQKLDVSQNPKI